MRERRRRAVHHKGKRGEKVRETSLRGGCEGKGFGGRKCVGGEDMWGGGWREESEERGFGGEIVKKMGLEGGSKGRG